MDKFVKILASENPTISLDCRNQDCKRTSKVKTEEFFGVADSYEFVCPYCGKSVRYNNIKEELDRLKKELKEIGAYW